MATTKVSKVAGVNVHAIVNKGGFALEERKSADKIYAEKHPCKEGKIVRINRNLTILVPHSVENVSEYIKRYKDNLAIHAAKVG